MLEAGATLIRSKKHLVFQLSNGKRFVMAKTGGNPNNTLDAITCLRRLMN